MIRRIKNLLAARRVNKPVLKNTTDKNQFVLLILLLLLLPVLALMQYFWLGQLSEAEEIRLKSNLASDAERFAEQFDRELTGIQQAFRIEDKAGAEFADALILKYRNWQNSTKYPDLIDEIYVVEFAGETHQLRLLDLTRGQLPPVKWPQKLLPFREQFPDSSNLLGPMLMSFTHGPIFDEVPLIVTNCLSLKSPDNFMENEMGINFSYLIIVLDKEIMGKKILRDLKEDYFSNRDDLQFDLAIVSDEDTARVFYLSDSTLNISNFEQAEVRTQIGRWRAEDFLFARAAVLKMDNKTTQTVDKIESSQLSIEVIRNDTTEESQIFKFLIARTAQWYLVVQNRHNTLAQIVNQARLRNLLISYSILMLLAVSMVMVFVSTRRARKLVARQVQFVGGIGHELRTPLAVIRSAAENLADGVISDPERLRKYGEMIRDEGRRLSMMVEQTLTFSGMQNNRWQYKFETLVLSDIINQCMRSVTDFYDQREINFSSSFAADLPQISADSASLKTAFENIISNAVKFSEGQVKIEISASLAADRDKIIIIFRDFGRGIDSADLPHIFEPFYRGNNNDAGQIAGSGLGLSLVKDIIELHGGRVKLESEVNIGTLFTVNLPVIQGNEEFNKTGNHAE